MKPSIYQKLEQLSERLAEIDGLLASEQAARDMDNYRKLTREHADIAPVVALFAAYRHASADFSTAGEMLGGLYYFNYGSGTGLVSGSVFGKLAGAAAVQAARAAH